MVFSYIYQLMYINSLSYRNLVIMLRSKTLEKRNISKLFYDGYVDDGDSDFKNP